MNDAKYIGLDVRQATISAAVLDSDGRLIMESILETKAATVLQFVHGLRGSLHITFEEGTCAAWLHALLQPHVTRVVVTFIRDLNHFHQLFAVDRKTVGQQCECGRRSLRPHGPDRREISIPRRLL